MGNLFPMVFSIRESSPLKGKKDSTRKNSTGDSLSAGERKGGVNRGVERGIFKEPVLSL